MAAGLPPRLRRELHQVALGVTFPDLLDVAAAVGTAEALVLAGRSDAATLAAASLPRGTTRMEAEPVLRELLLSHGIPVPPTGTEDERYRAVLIAFGSWDLPFPWFTSAFHARLPDPHDQQPLDRELHELLDRRDHEPWVGSAERRELETLLRATVRAAYPAPEEGRAEDGEPSPPGSSVTG